ncbi:MAG TPA: type II toxin-antitoxin system RelE/ParE family toxin [Rhizomicrobium sp.]|jgi:toxin ParE1/3/4|nr:type II toxin-antitoxin system RelE/ParE family toxin [Rhizomicrobium sp.]
MRRYRLSPAAQSDLDEIWTYSADHWGMDRADRYIRDLIGAVGKIAGGKWRGSACDDIRPGYFRCACESHVIFYRLTAGTVDVVRILHQRMDFTQRL